MSDMKVLIDGLVFGEGPRWHDGALWFSDMHGQQVHRAELGDDANLLSHEVIADFDEAPSGLGWLPDGTLLAVAMESQQLLKVSTNGSISRHADCSDIARGTLNDMIVRSDGTAYIGDMGYRIFSAHPDHSRPGQTLRVTPDGAVSCAADELRSPNGHVLSEDERTLYVAESSGSRITAFSVQPDGALVDQRHFADLPRADGMSIAPPDGICLDAEGAIWAADPITRRVIRFNERGELLSEINFATELPVAVVLGAPDRRTLFACVASDYRREEVLKARTGRIVCTRVSVPGAGKP